MMALATNVQVSTTPLRPVARWVLVTDENGRSRLVMAWQVPDPDEALKAVAAVPSR